MTEWIWVFLVFYIFSLFYAYLTKDSMTKALASVLGIIFGILFLGTQAILAVGIIAVNFYFLFSSMSD